MQHAAASPACLPGLPLCNGYVLAVWLMDAMSAQGKIHNAGPANALLPRHAVLAMCSS
jgi:hypothetical protein